MLLLIDIGNSNILFSVSTREKILHSYRLSTNSAISSDEYFILFSKLIGQIDIEHCFISSVVPSVCTILKRMVADHYNIKPYVLGHGLKTKVGIVADDPKSVGSDLICDVSGGFKYGDEGLIIDLGTATKYVYYKNKKLCGVSIGLGVAVSLKALINSAALLPSVELEKPKKVLNNSTVPCMQSGVVYGTAASVDGMIDRIKEEVGNNNLKVISTGGLAPLIMPFCKHDYICDPNLTMDGLLRIANINLENDIRK